MIMQRLSTVPASPDYDLDACKRVKAVYVNDVHIPDCVAYSMDEGWAFGKVKGIWQPKVYGEVRVTER